MAGNPDVKTGTELSIDTAPGTRTAHFLQDFLIPPVAFAFDSWGFFLLLFPLLLEHLMFLIHLLGLLLRPFQGLLTTFAAEEIFIMGGECGE